jgi:hypothetical protein
MLEDLVHKMSRRFEERPAVGYGGARGGPDPVPSRGLMEIVREALAENRVDLYLQPVVSLPQRRTMFYESFSRLRDPSGKIIMPAEYLAVAEPAGLVTAIDNLLLFRCAQIVRRLARQDRKVGVFCNVALSSLGDETFFPQFLNFLSENRDLNQALIFELGQATFDARGAVEARNMAKLADLGFRFSIDRGAALEGTYEICFPNGCFAESRLDAKQLEVMKRGTAININVKNQANAEVVFVVPLEGFGKAFDGPAVDPKVLEEQQKALQAELQKRADDERRRHEGTAAAPAAPAAQR